MITGASNICDRCKRQAFAILNRLSGFYECELCAPGLHAWSRHGVGTSVHVGPVDLKRVARDALKKQGFGDRDIARFVDLDIDAKTGSADDQGLFGHPMFKAVRDVLAERDDGSLEKFDQTRFGPIPK
jgi:hypothetical protein